MYLGCRQTLTSFIIISYVGEAKFLQCKFCPEVEKLFITNGNVSGLRKDLNGVLLLDSILQPPFKGPCMEPVVFELTLSDVSIKYKVQNIQQTGLGIDCEMFQPMMGSVWLFSGRNLKLMVSFPTQKKGLEKGCWEWKIQITLSLFYYLTSPKIDQYLISPDKITPESNIEVTRKREMVTDKKKALDCYTNFTCQHLTNSMKNIHSDVKVERVMLQCGMSTGS